MKNQQKKDALAERVLQLPCSLAELQGILRKCELRVVDEHVRRLEKQLEVTKHVMEQLEKDQAIRRESEVAQRWKVFQEMTSEELRAYVEGGGPYRELAERILMSRNSGPAGKRNESPCEPGADSDYWRIQGG